jgi:uncharacterized protein YcnI
MNSARPVFVAAIVGVIALGAGGSTALAHTDSDYVAVPATSEATVTLKPTNGCAGSPTVEVRIRAPLEDVQAVAVEGWTETSEPDGEGNSVLSWAAGELPADETGAFPVTFTVPATVGELLLFPAVQRCANGDELAWIDGDPEGEFPAPRLLVLDAGAEPAETIDDVPADAPGRDQLIDVVDVDNPVASSAPATSAAPHDTATDR